MTPKIVFAGVVQNASHFLPAILNNIERISSLASEAGYVFVENDSTDGTKLDLQNWGLTKENFQLISLDGLNQITARTVRLELLRNTYIEFIRQSPKLSKFEYLVIMDMDDIGVYPIDEAVFSEALNFLESAPIRAAVFANQLGTYYDMWALRSNELCPNDIWEEVLDYAHEYKVTDEEAFAETFAKKILTINPKNKHISVDSAFGGFGIYKMKFINANQNPYIGSKVKILRDESGQPVVLRTQICEHVHFHLGIRACGGEMYIFPSLINGKNFGVTFPPSAFRLMLF